MTPEHIFIVGAQRSGTTYLHGMLDEHPQVCMAGPVRPEPKFFLRADFPSLTMADYVRSYFRDSTAPARGEKSTSYIESVVAAERIAEWFPNARIVMVLRDPIDRAVSNFAFSRRNGLESLPMEQAFLNEENRTGEYDVQRISASPYAYLSRGRYIDYLNAYERRFPPDLIHVYIFEQLVGNPEAVSEVFGDLGLDPEFVPASVNQVVNAAPGGEKIPALLEQELMRYFRQSVVDLRKRLGRPLSAWRDY